MAVESSSSEMSRICQYLQDCRQKDMVKTSSNDTYRRGSFDDNYGGRTFIYAPNGGCRSHSSSSDKKHEAIIWGAITIISCSIFFAYAIKNYFSALFQINTTNRMVCLDNASIDQTLQSRVRALAVQQKDIDDIEYSKDRNYLLATIGGLVGGSFLLIGGLYSLANFIAMGMILTLVACIWALINLSSYGNDTSDITAKKLNCLSEISQLIQHYSLYQPIA